MFERVLHGGDDVYEAPEPTSVAYKIVATLIFAFMSFNFFFPYNRIFPLDRRTASAIAGTLCYVTRAFFFPNHPMDLVDAIDWDVIILLAGIMCINYIVVNQKETKNIEEYVQNQIKYSPKNGFWLVSSAAFIVSPFLTNDGVCLLFVEPILSAFEGIASAGSSHGSTGGSSHGGSSHGGDSVGLDIGFALEKSDAIYFLLGLACSSNIGSALTYTGNPQNMIVSSSSIDVMPPYLFLVYMIVPSLASWLITLMYIQRCWEHERAVRTRGLSLLNPNAPVGKHQAITSNPMMIGDGSYHDDETASVATVEHERQIKQISAVDKNRAFALQQTINERRAKKNRKLLSLVEFNKQIETHEHRDAPANTIGRRVAKVLISPFPYAIMILMAIMIALIFVDIMSIAGLICVTACVMTLCLVLGNHYLGMPIFGGDETAAPLTSEEKAMNTSLFFDELFDSIDYSLLIIFLGTFIVVENMDSTGLPKKLWDAIVGDVPFKTAKSVFGISAFVLFSSQFLGNVAVIQIVKPNVDALDDASKRYAWAVLSFVATVGGNLTITGSAANIIVAEKASRIDPTSNMDFFKHGYVCFLVTLFSCIMGALMITAVVMMDNSMRESG